MSDVTSILAAIDLGVPNATDNLLPLVYDELRRLAVVQMAQEKPGHTLQATALVHEAYLRLVGNAGAAEINPADNKSGRWNSRGHFFAAAAEAMRRILVDQARKKQAEKRGGSRQRVALAEAIAPEALQPLELLALNEALDRLGESHPQHAGLVKLRYFAGLTLEDAASNLGISLATAKRHWIWARAWLFEQLAGQPEQV